MTSQDDRMFSKDTCAAATVAPIPPSGTLSKMLFLCTHRLRHWGCNCLLCTGLLEGNSACLFPSQFENIKSRIKRTEQKSWQHEFSPVWADPVCRNPTNDYLQGRLISHAMTFGSQECFERQDWNIGKQDHCSRYKRQGMKVLGTNILVFLA